MPFGNPLALLNAKSVYEANKQKNKQLIINLISATEQTILENN